MILELSRPTEHELRPYNKSIYYTRMLESIDYHKKYGITQTQFSSWIHYNYSSVFLEGKSINLQQLKKLLV